MADIKLPAERMYKGILLNEEVFPTKILDRVCDFKLRSDDVIVMGYPKSGTTWLQEIVWLLMNNLDSGEFYQRDIWDRVPLIEQTLPNENPKIELVEAMDSPRLFKTHLPTWSLEKQIMEKKSKVILINRNPKDQVVSYYHFAQMIFPGIVTSWSVYFEMYCCGNMHYGTWFDYINTWYKNHQHDENFLFLKYEDLKYDFQDSVQKIAKFLDVNVDDTALEALSGRVSFESMKDNPHTNLETCKLFVENNTKFMRKGKVGDWKNYFTVAQNERMNELIKEKLKDVDITFSYE